MDAERHTHTFFEAVRDERIKIKATGGPTKNYVLRITVIPPQQQQHRACPPPALPPGRRHLESAGEHHTTPYHATPRAQAQERQHRATPITLLYAVMGPDHRGLTLFFVCLFYLHRSWPPCCRSSGHGLLAPFRSLTPPLACLHVVEHNHRHCFITTRQNREGDRAATA